MYSCIYICLLFNQLTDVRIPLFRIFLMPLLTVLMQLLTEEMACSMHTCTVIIYLTNNNPIIVCEAHFNCAMHKINIEYQYK